MMSHVSADIELSFTTFLCYGVRNHFGSGLRMLLVVPFMLLLLPCEASEGTCEKYACRHPDERDIKVVMIAVNAATNEDLQRKLEVSLGSMLEHSSRRIFLYVITDARSHDIISRTAKHKDSNILTLEFLEVEDLAHRLTDVIGPMQKHFSSSPGSYYSHALFFFSVALHKIIKDDKVIMLDTDLKFTNDISELYKSFDAFNDSNIIGIAREAQPVYRHTFHNYRAKNPGTRVGEPPPYGLTGFNSGVLLLDLSRIRMSRLYEELLDVNNFSVLAEEFEFRGHLGDQDFYTLLSMKHEELFYVLPCQWNRQLCQWWRNHGYAEVFEDYYRCTGAIHIYHGNCDTPIP